MWFWTEKAQDRNWNSGSKSFGTFRACLRMGAVAVLLSTAPTHAAAAARASAVPVSVGGEEHIDACALARVRTANLPVRGGPGRRFAIRDRLPAA